MTESDLPYIKPEPEIPPEANEVVPPSQDVKNPVPSHEPIETMEIGAFNCLVCGRSFIIKADLDLHMQKTIGAFDVCLNLSVGCYRNL